MIDHIIKCLDICVDKVLSEWHNNTRNISEGVSPLGERKKGIMSPEEQIQRLKKEKDAVILAHYYVPDEVQAVADFIGDSYGLAKLAVNVPEKTICFAGVKFMSESAKILNPEKTVLVPEMMADCPMAHMVSLEDIENVRAEYDDLAVVCYINSTAEIKKYADVIVTSSNAMKIVRGLKEKNIFFIPDQNLGRYIAGKLPEKNFIFNYGYCHVHTGITEDEVKLAKSKHPGVKMLAHPECTGDVLKHADYIGSTSGIIDFATESEDEEFIICTELGVLYDLKNKNPGKKFYNVNDHQCCPDMKKVTLEKIIKSLETMEPVMDIDTASRLKAATFLERMLELAK